MINHIDEKLFIEAFTKLAHTAGDRSDLRNSLLTTLENNTKDLPVESLVMRHLSMTLPAILKSDNKVPAFIALINEISVIMFTMGVESGLGYNEHLQGRL